VHGVNCISVPGSGVPGTFVKGTMVQGTSVTMVQGTRVLDPGDSNIVPGSSMKGVCTGNNYIYRISIGYMLTYILHFKILCSNKIIKRSVLKFFLEHQKTKKYVFPR
jgi:hypothetical protein